MNAIKYYSCNLFIIIFVKFLFIKALRVTLVTMCLLKCAGENLLSIVEEIIECSVLFSTLEMHNIFFWIRLSQINIFSITSG
ncbi:hypothetical protein B7764_00050 [Pantoea ananatis]|nr:hypothetical protein B7764_00050 [Pantoea ananatis]